MNKAHEIKLYPTKGQTTLIKKSCGCARYSYNWALSKWEEMVKQGEIPSAYTLIKLQNSIKRGEMPFLLEVSKTAPQYAIHNLANAFTKMRKENRGYPKYKKKGSKESYVAVENKKDFKQIDNKIWLPRIGWVRCAENLRFEGKIINVIVKRVADMYFAVVNVEVPNCEPTLKTKNGDSQTIVGVDLGIKTMAVLSDGTFFENPKALKANFKKLKRMQRSFCRKLKGSNNRKKQQIKLAKLHYRISCVRKNAIHSVTAKIVENYDVIVIEDLNVRGMLKNPKLSKSISDIGFGEIKRQLTYKALWQNKELIVADRFYASSKICSCCGHKKEFLKLSERIYKCESCGIEIDRDLNAAKNLANYGSTSKFEGTYACGEISSTSKKKCRISKKQEINDLSNKLRLTACNLKNL